MKHGKQKSAVGLVKLQGLLRNVPLITGYESLTSSHDSFRSVQLLAKRSFYWGTRTEHAHRWLLHIQTHYWRYTTKK